MDQAQDFRCRNQDRRQLRLRPELCRVASPKKPASARHILPISRTRRNLLDQLAAKSDWTWCVSSAIGRKAHGRESARQGNRAVLAPSSISSAEVPEIPAYSQRSRVLCAGRLNRSISNNISTAYCSNPRCARHARRDRMTSATRNSRQSFTCFWARAATQPPLSYTERRRPPVPDHVISAYEKLITRGLFHTRAARNKATHDRPGGHCTGDALWQPRQLALHSDPARAGRGSACRHRRHRAGRL